MESKTEKRKVLVFIDWFLPGDKAGGPIRSCANLIDHLEDSFSFSVVTRDTDYTEHEPYKTVKSDEWNILPDGKRVYYISREQLHRETISKLVSEENYDIVYLNGIWSVPFTHWPLIVLQKQSRHTPVVVAVRGMLAPSALAIKLLKKKIFLVYARITGLFSNVIFHATTEKEAGETRRIFRKNEIRVAGNLPRLHSARPVIHEKKMNILRIINIARIAPEKNTLYALQVLQQVTQPVEADFFGPVYNDAYRQECLSAAAKMPPNVKVQFKGAIDSGKVFETLLSYDLFFLPSRGENFGHVILEAMQAGIPVLISDQTPWKDLANKKAGWDFPLRFSSKFSETIDAVSRMDKTEWQKWSAGAMACAEEYSVSPALLDANRRLFLG